MAMTPEEKRKREAERKRRQRQAAREKQQLEALPRIGPSGRSGGGTDSGTKSGTAGGTEIARVSNAVAATEFLAELDVPASAKPLAALLVTLAMDLDSGAVAQRSAISQRYAETMEKLVAAAKPVQISELDRMRRAFYTGSVDAIDDDPEASQRRPVRQKA